MQEMGFGFVGCCLRIADRLTVLREGIFHIFVVAAAVFFFFFKGCGRSNIHQKGRETFFQIPAFFQAIVIRGLFLMVSIAS